MPLTPEALLQSVTRVLDDACAGAVLETSTGQGEVTVTLTKSKVKTAIAALRDDAELHFEFLSDLTAIDYLNLEREPRFDVVYHLYSLDTAERVRLKAPVEEDDCSIESICDLWSGASFMEREVYDLMGIRFDGHPDMRRILMPDDWEGHPLRKDFPIGGSKSFYYKHDTNEYAGEPDDLVPRIRVQDGDI